MSDAISKPQIDVRTIPPHLRHPAIFEMVGSLKLGQSFIVVADHAPRPLHYHLETRYPGQFSWDYIEEGPDVWRVEIGRVNAHVEDHVCTCGGH